MILLLGIILVLLYVIIRRDTICGVTENGVIAYCNSSKYNLSDHYLDGLPTGKKWQCVEFVRRYYMQIHGLTFPSVANAYEMMKLTEFIDIHTQQSYPYTFYSPTESIPQKDDILIIEHGKYGHTAIIVCIQGNRIRIAEQNWDPWVAPYYSRELLVNDPLIIGWLGPFVRRTKHAVPFPTEQGPSVGHSSSQTL
jgi:surface antigen